MARKTSKKAATTVTVQENDKKALGIAEKYNVKTMDPKDPETKHSGPEPLFTFQPENRKLALVKSLNWYGKFYGRKNAKEVFSQFLDLTNHPKASLVKKADDNELNLSICWLTRLHLRGLELTEEENTAVSNEINRLVDTVVNPESKASKTGKNKELVKKESNRVNVQEIMKEKAREAGGELEGMFDDFILAGAKSTYTVKPMDHVAKKNVLPQHIPMLVDAWKRKKTEYEEVLKGTDAQLVQAYNHHTKTQVKNLIKFIEQVISDLSSYISIKKASKAPRARKAVPIERRVMKLKFLKEFKDEASKLNLISLPPVKLYGASEAWVYDTAKRKLLHFVADEYSKTFTIKGNTLIGFDTKTSEVKTLRKPSEQLKEIMGSKPAARKYFKDIRAVSTSPNGRFNQHMVILKAF